MRYDTVMGIYTGCTYFFLILRYALIIYALSTWFVRPDSQIYRFLSRFCEPIVAPFRPLGRKLINVGLRIDLSVWFALIALQIVSSLIERLLFSLLW